MPVPTIPFPDHVEPLHRSCTGVSLQSTKCHIGGKGYNIRGNVTSVALLQNKVALHVSNIGTEVLSQLQWHLAGRTRAIPGCVGNEWAMAPAQLLLGGGVLGAQLSSTHPVRFFTSSMPRAGRQVAEDLAGTPIAKATGK